MEIIKIKTADDFHNENVKPGHVIEKYKNDEKITQSQGLRGLML